MVLVGYARVSSVGQSLEVQLDQLRHCDKIFQESPHGLSRPRPQLKACLDYIQAGDTLVVTRLDHLARSNVHLAQIAQALECKGTHLHVLEPHLDTRDGTGRLLFHLLEAMGQFEAALHAERRMDGVGRTRARGIRVGPKCRLTEGQIAELRRRRAQGDLISVLMQDYGLSQSSVYRYLRTDGRFVS
jgi:DNA invertase Pin-like site-specific DNA recombinase